MVVFGFKHETNVLGINFMLPTFNHKMAADTFESKSQKQTEVLRKD